MSVEDDIESALVIMRMLDANLISLRAAIDAMNGFLDSALRFVPIGAYVELPFTRSKRLYVIVNYEVDSGMYHVAAAAEPDGGYWTLLRDQFRPLSPLEALTMELSSEIE